MCGVNIGGFVGCLLQNVVELIHSVVSKDEVTFSRTFAHCLLSINTATITLDFLQLIQFWSVVNNIFNIIGVLLEYVSDSAEKNTKQKKERQSSLLYSMTVLFLVVLFSNQPKGMFYQEQDKFEGLLTKSDFLKDLEEPFCALISKQKGCSKVSYAINIDHRNFLNDVSKMR